MRAHILDADGVITNTVMVDQIEFGMCDACIGGGPGDRIINGVVVRKAIPELTTEEHNAPILAKLAELDMKSIRPLREGNTQWVAAIEKQAAELRAKLRKD